MHDGPAAPATTGLRSSVIVTTQMERGYGKTASAATHRPASPTLLSTGDQKESHQQTNKPNGHSPQCDMRWSGSEDYSRMEMQGRSHRTHSVGGGHRNNIPRLRPSFARAKRGVHNDGGQEAKRPEGHCQQQGNLNRDSNARAVPTRQRIPGSKRYPVFRLGAPAGYFSGGHSTPSKEAWRRGSCP